MGKGGRMMHAGIGCPLCHGVHFGLVRNYFGWALYVGPFYLMRIR